MILFKILFYCFGIISLIKCQYIIDASPFNLYLHEMDQYTKNINNHSLLLRPLLNENKQQRWSLSVKNELFFNSNLPNLENIGNRWIGKGISSFNSISFSYSNKFIFLSIEPYHFSNQNQSFEDIQRPSPENANSDVFNVLNDNRYFTDKPYISRGLRESQIFINYNDIFIGISNANMWWGPGIHSSLTMTNNTKGFPYLLFGTLKEKQIKRFGFDVRYIITKLNKVNGSPYYTALVWSARINTHPIISIGFSRNYLSGGGVSSDNISLWEAALLPFEALFIDSKIKNNSNENVHDSWDQVLSGFLTIEFPVSQLKFFIELGTDDHRQNLSDLRSQPEHNSANIIGIRKYGLFNNKSLFSGFEYANIKQSFTYIFRGGGHWWWKEGYDYNTYEGRRWAAHSGSDSDDFYLYFGYNSNKLVIIPGFNYERHGIISGNPPEVKTEFRLDIQFQFKKYLINLYFEKELLNNIAFVDNKKQMSNIFSFGIERNFSSLIKN